MRKFFVVLFVLVLLLQLGSLALAKDKPLIAFSQCTMNHPWRVAMTNDVKFWAEKYGVDLIWNDGQNDAATQLASAEDLLVKKPDALIISPLQGKALLPILEKCNELKIPLITIDRGLDATPGEGMYLTHITRDNIAMAKELGEFVAEALKEKYGEYKGNIIEIQGTVGATPTIERHNGFLEALEKYPNIKIIASQSADYVRPEAIKVMENYLQRYKKGEIDFIYAHNDEMALGAIQAIKSAGRDELLGKIVSIDGQRNALKSILDGDHFAVGTYQPYYAKEAIAVALDYLNGKEVPPTIILGFRIFHAQDSEARNELEDYYYELKQEDKMY